MWQLKPSPVSHDSRHLTVSLDLPLAPPYLFTFSVQLLPLTPIGFQTLPDLQDSQGAQEQYQEGAELDLQCPGVVRGVLHGCGGVVAVVFNAVSFARFSVSEI